MNERIRIAIEANIESIRRNLNQLEKNLNEGFTDSKLRSEDIGYCWGMLHAIKYMIESELYVELDNRYQEVKELYYRKVIDNFED